MTHATVYLLNVPDRMRNSVLQCGGYDHSRVISDGNPRCIGSLYFGARLLNVASGQHLSGAVR